MYPPHIATDSASAKSAFETIKQRIKDHPTRYINAPSYMWPLGKPWALFNDWDLWEPIFQNLASTKAQTTAITKVKGHATKQQVEEGKVKPMDKVGDDVADITADDRLHTHGWDTVEMGKLLARRHKDYQAFVIRVHKLIICVMNAHTAIYEEQELYEDPTGNIGKTLVSIGLKYEDTQADCIRIVLTTIPRNAQDIININRSTVHQIRSFINDQVWAICNDVYTQGVSCIELFAHATLQGSKYRR